MTGISPELASTVAAIVDGGSLDVAARTLRITPSAVSQRLKSLEQQLGQVLVVRGRPARATVNADSMATWFLAPLARVAGDHDIDFDLHRDDQTFTARLLESGEVMAAVTSEHSPVTGCTVTPLGVLRYEAMATPAFVERWFADGVTAGALQRAPFVDFDRRDTLQHAWLRSRGLDEQGIPRHYVPASHDYAQAVLLGLGWGMLPGSQATDAAASGAAVPLGGDPIRVPLYWQQWNLRSPLLDAIASEITAEAARVLD